MPFLNICDFSLETVSQLHNAVILDLTRHAVNVQRNIEALSYTYGCSDKAISITWCVCLFVCVVLFIQDTMRMPYGYLLTA
jgi:hypothetical protein